MRLLLDTCVLLWWLADPKLLKASGRAAVSDRRNTVFVSAATAWEIAIKRGKPGFDAPEDLDAAIASEGFLPMPITFAHARAVEALPMIHKDPFDRMLIAQARVENLLLLTRDPHILDPGYATPGLLA